MYKSIRTLIVCAVVQTWVSTSYSAFAQDVDLSSQYQQIKGVNRVPGQKIDHKGVVINPTPQQITLTGSTVDFSKGLKPQGELQKIIPLVPELKCNDNGLVIVSQLVKDLGICGKSLGNKSGGYTLEISPEGVLIKAYDQRGVFYALQTLRQILCGGIEPSQIPSMLIEDYPVLNDRGVVEGFYGNPWSHKQRLSLIDFFGRNKLNVYIYGPKDDPYHNCPNWRLPYPEREANQIKELVEACEANFVDFVWAVHPGQDYKWDEEDYNLLISKLQSMYDLGVRRFALFFDDINGEGTNPHNQTKLLNRITDEFVTTHPGVYPLTICPTDYSMIWANPTEDGALAIYGRELNPQISVMWTGTVVCGDLLPSALQFINSRTKRPAYFWWNYPVQDYVREVILQGPVYGLYKNVTPNNLTAFVSNPMEHGEASKLALYSVADYTWNPLEYNALDSWERGLVDIAGDAADAYRRFAIHSCDTQSGYRRDESWETPTFTLDGWSDAAATALEKEFELIENTPGQLRQSCQNAELVAELDPWLDELAALGTRGGRVIDLGRKYRALPEQLDNTVAEGFWNHYLSLNMNDQQKASYSRHKVGTLRLQPFYQGMMEDMGKGFYDLLTNGVPGGNISLRKDLGTSDGTRSNANAGSESSASTDESADTPSVESLFDQKLTTGYKLADNDMVELDILAGTGKILVLSGENPQLTITEVNSKGKTLKKTTVTTPMVEISLYKSTTGIIIKGKGEVFEVI